MRPFIATPLTRAEPWRSTNMTTTPAYGPGDTIEYRTFSGRSRRVVVEFRDDDIKDGQPGFDGLEVGTQEGVWGYDDQVVRVISRAT